MTCKAQTIQLLGQAPIAISGNILATEFKKVSSQTWTVKTGNMHTLVTFHGVATAGCVAKR